MSYPLLVKRIEVVPQGLARVPVNVPGAGNGAPRMMLPARAPMWDSDASQLRPVVVIGGQAMLRVTVDAPGVPPGAGYGLSAWLQTASGERVMLFNGSALSGLPFTADVALQVQPTGFVALTGALVWELTDDHGNRVALGDAFVALYFLPKAPIAAMPQGLPVELLQAFVRYAEATGWHLQPLSQGQGPLKLLGYTLSTSAEAQPVDAAEQVAMATQFCFNHNPPVYNSVGGGLPGYTRADHCQLLRWTLATAPPVCSCEDQTAVLWFILTTFFGRSVKTCGIAGGPNRTAGQYWITAQGLVGHRYDATLQPGQGPYGLELVNNPLWGREGHGAYASGWVVAPGAPGERSNFSFHFFCRVTDAGNVIADATLGPICGQVSLEDYLKLIVDPSYPGNGSWQSVLAQCNTDSAFMLGRLFDCV
jgi:hypothetical protein